MERWAANTLRIIGIIFASIIVVCGCLLLLLLGKCAAGGGFEGSRNPGAATSYYFGAVVLGFAGIWFIAWLARGIHRSGQISPALSPSSPTAAPIDSIAAGSRSIQVLTWCLIAQLVINALFLVRTVLLYQRMSYLRQSITPAVISDALFALPYALLLLYFIRRSISRAVLAFAIGVPAASILMLLITGTTFLRFYLQNPVNLATLVVPLILHVVIIIFAYQAQQPTGLILPVSSLLTATVAALVYFYSLHLIFQFLIRRFVR